MGMTSPTGIAIAHRAFVVQPWLQTTQQEMTEKQGSLHPGDKQLAPCCHCLDTPKIETLGQERNPHTHIILRYPSWLLWYI